MLKFLNLVLKNLGRNKLRTTLTALAVMVLVAVYIFCSSVTDTINRLVAAHSSQSRLIVREKWVVPSRFPVRYVPRIAAVPGVEDWTVWHFYAGALDNAGHGAAGIATRVDNLAEMHAGMELLDPRLVEALRHEKTGALVGQRIMKQMGFKVGQKFTLLSTTHVGQNLAFKIVGVLPSDLWSRNFFFREDYFREALDQQDMVNILWLRVTDAETGKRAAAKIEQMFDGSQVQLKVESESAGIARFAGRTSTLVNIVNFIVAILLVDMVVVLSNSINMTVRERTSEMAILKVLGFPPMHIMAMVVGEAVIVGAAAGAAGAAAACLFSAVNAAGQLPLRISFLAQFPIGPWFILHGLVVGALVGMAGSALPAWNAQKIQVAEAFARAG